MKSRAKGGQLDLGLDAPAPPERTSRPSAVLSRPSLATEGYAQKAREIAAELGLPDPFPGPKKP